MAAEESNLVAHARRELTIIGQFEEDQAFADSIIVAVKGFVSYGGHSGGSAAVARGMLHQLLAFGNLAPLTDNPDEWFDHGDNVWQNKRNSACFSADGGKTYYSVDDPDRTIETSSDYEVDRLDIDSDT